MKLNLDYPRKSYKGTCIKWLCSKGQLIEEKNGSKNTGVGGIMRLGIRFSWQTQLDYVRAYGNQSLIFNLFYFYLVYTRHEWSGTETDGFLSLVIVTQDFICVSVLFFTSTYNDFLNFCHVEHKEKLICVVWVSVFLSSYHVSIPRFLTQISL